MRGKRYEVTMLHGDRIRLRITDQDWVNDVALDDLDTAEEVANKIIELVRARRLDRDRRTT